MSNSSVRPFPTATPCFYKKTRSRKYNANITVICAELKLSLWNFDGQLTQMNISQKNIRRIGWYKSSSSRLMWKHTSPIYLYDRAGLNVQLILWQTCVKPVNFDIKIDHKLISRGLRQMCLKWRPNYEFKENNMLKKEPQQKLSRKLAWIPSFWLFPLLHSIAWLIGNGIQPFVTNSHLQNAWINDLVDILNL